MELTKESFSRIIRATAAGVDWEEFGVAVAASHPQLFISVLESLDVGWKTVAVNMGDDGQSYVDVVKYVRNETKMGLKDAKEWVDVNVPSTKEYPDSPK